MIKNPFTNRTLDEATAVRQYLPELGYFWLPLSVVRDSSKHMRVLTTAPCSDGTTREVFCYLPKRDQVSDAKATALGLERYYQQGFNFSDGLGVAVNGHLVFRCYEITYDLNGVDEDYLIHIPQNGSWVTLPFVELSRGRRTNRQRSLCYADGTIKQIRTLDGFFTYFGDADLGEWKDGRMSSHGQVFFENDETFDNHATPPDLAGYHGQARRHHDSSKLNDSSVAWRVGWEVEKDDRTARNKACRMNCVLGGGWVAERDGSLDPDIGVEFVSPVFDLMDTKTQHAEFDRLDWAMNSNKSKRCGGHITLSHRDLRSKHLLEKLYPFIPMLFALYEGRLAGVYSGVQTKSEIDNESRRAIHLKSSCVEIRIPSGVTNVDELKWRLKLVRWIAKSIDANKFTHYHQVAEAMFDDTKLNKMLSVYYNIDKLRRKQALTYLFGSLLEGDSAKSFVSPERQAVLLERMRQAWTSVGSSIRSEVVGRFSTTAITSKLA